MPRYAAATALALVLPLALAGCGSDDARADEPADPATTAVTGAPSPTPTPTSSGPPPQPKGAHGVTYSLLNWDRYADDPAVRAWVRINEAINASTNTGTVLKAVLQHTSKEVQRLVVGQIQFSWRNHLHVKPVARNRIKSVTGHGGQRTIVACMWTPSTDFYQSNGEFYGELERKWRGLRFGMAKKANGWSMHSVKIVADCKGGAPR